MHNKKRSAVRSGVANLPLAEPAFPIPGSQRVCLWASLPGGDSTPQGIFLANHQAGFRASVLLFHAKLCAANSDLTPCHLNVPSSFLFRKHLFRQSAACCLQLPPRMWVMGHEPLSLDGFCRARLPSPRGGHWPTGTWPAGSH